MKALLVSPTLNPTNGWGNITLELCTKLAKTIDLTLLLPRGAAIPAGLPFKALAVLPELSLYPFNWSNLLSYGSAAGIIARHAAEVDFIHSLFSFPCCVPASMAAKNTDKPFVMGVQGTYGVKPLRHPLNGFLLRSAYRQAAKVLCASSYTEQRIKEKCPWVSSLVLPNGVNFGRFQHSEGVNKLRRGLASNHVVLSVGALKPRKGFHVLIKAIDLVRKRLPDVKYVIAGEGAMRPELERLVSSLGLEANVSLLGQVDGPTLVDYFHACDVYAHTPVNLDDEFEGFGIVYVEAGACGKPVLGSRSGGVETAVLDGQTGLLVPEGDVQATAEALIKLLAEKELAARFGEAGRTRARQLDWGNYARRLLGLYGEVLP